MVKRILVLPFMLTSLFVLCVTFCLADVIILKDGTRIEGKIIEENSKEVKVQFKFGSCTYKRTDIKKIIYQKTPEEEYAEKLKGIDKDSPDDHEKLADWCKEKGLTDLEQKHRAEARILRLKERVKKEGGSLCPICKGSGVEECSRCRGERYLRQPCTACGGIGSIQCPSCEGSGKMICHSCNGKGKIGRVVTEYERKKIEKQCPRCEGSGEVTDKRLEYDPVKGWVWVTYVVKCPDCEGKGKIAKWETVPVGPKIVYKKCEECGGRGTLRCKKCQGRGTVKCPSCDGRKMIRRKCPLCEGKGKLVCDTCKGEGIIQEKSSGGSLSITDIVKMYKSAVVAIVTDKGQSIEGRGTGFIIDTKGEILTAYHVVSDVRKITVFVSVKANTFKSFEGRLIAKHPEADIAKIKIDPGTTKLTSVRLGWDVKMEAGEEVFTIGNPLGLTHSVTRGTLSHPDRKRGNIRFLQLAMSLNSGNSGGPVFNKEGKVIGIVSFKFRQDPKDVTEGNIKEGISFAVSIEHAKDEHLKPIRK